MLKYYSDVKSSVNIPLIIMLFLGCIAYFLHSIELVLSHGYQPNVMYPSDELIHLVLVPGYIVFARKPITIFFSNSFMPRRIARGEWLNDILKAGSISVTIFAAVLSLTFPFSIPFASLPAYAFRLVTMLILFWCFLFLYHVVSLLAYAVLNSYNLTLMTVLLISLATYIISAYTPYMPRIRLILFGAVNEQEELYNIPYLQMLFLLVSLTLSYVISQILKRSSVQIGRISL